MPQLSLGVKPHLSATEIPPCSGKQLPIGDWGREGAEQILARILCSPLLICYLQSPTFHIDVGWPLYDSYVALFSKWLTRMSLLSNELIQSLPFRSSMDCIEDNARMRPTR